MRKLAPVRLRVQHVGVLRQFRRDALHFGERHGVGEAHDVRLAAREPVGDEIGPRRSAEGARTLGAHGLPLVRSALVFQTDDDAVRVLRPGIDSIERANGFALCRCGGASQPHHHQNARQSCSKGHTHFLSFSNG